MDFIHTQKFVLTSPKKLREVAYLVKNFKPREAVEKLPFIGKKAGETLRKVIETAIANARQKEVSEDSLSIKEVQIMEGPRLKRFRAGARGRAKPYKKRMSHIRVVLTNENNQLTKSKGQKNSDVAKNEDEDKKIPNKKVKK